MARAGSYRDRVTFQESQSVSDGAGGQTTAWVDLVTVWGNYRAERGTEAMKAGAVLAASRGTLKVRYSSQVAGINATYRAVIRGEVHDIQSVINPDRRWRELEMVLVRGGSGA
ncbi:phage head closure protein [Roseibium sp. RKSG952]|uniref:phage head closure protein n=1 Tax=Roseibium sp. RKSG952 TaxID=2529384 RepID=UPI0012BCD618|nr:phage head closure protein [Roseibium sp. RKSG952]MTH96647.1 head-tail adaptor protein [Roseibium sp. RKSG952]